MNIAWTPLTTEEAVKEIQERSHDVPCLIFKHSTRCNISTIAKYRLEDDWRFPQDTVASYFLDLLRYRPVSNQVAEAFDVYHESPQVLLIVKGECVYEASHLDISVEELEEALNAAAVKN